MNLSIPLLLACAVISLLFVAGCTNITANAGKGEPAHLTTVSSDNTVERVEVYHFHRTQQGYSCKTVGAFAEETVKTYFPDELKTGALVFGHINVELPENELLVEQYGPTGPSLWIGIYNKSGFHKEENSNVWYKINDQEAYMKYLSDLIQKRLNGDLT
jgi:hypothetical protein